ncbi:MAG: DUF4347 domain-containing protein [Planctomycetota bacterium]
MTNSTSRQSMRRLRERTDQRIRVRGVSPDGTGLPESITSPRHRVATRASWLNQVNSPSTDEAEDSKALRRELVLIDRSVPGHRRLVDELQSDASSFRKLVVVTLDVDDDGIDQLSMFLDTHRGFDALHLVSRGEQGAFRLGATWFDNFALAASAPQIVQWGSCLHKAGEIFLYGCGLNECTEGQLLVNRLALLSRRPVAAYDNGEITASRTAAHTMDFTQASFSERDAMGSPRIIEPHEDQSPFVRTDDAHSPIAARFGRPVHEAATASFRQNSIASEDLRFAATFKNRGCQSGRGAFIDLIIPSRGFGLKSSRDCVEFRLATFAGNVLPTWELTFPDDGSGIGSVMHPFFWDSNGPIKLTGRAGDKLVVVELPFGEIAPGQPFVSAEITAAFHYPANRNGAFSDNELPVIQARSGFRFGIDPDENPALGPSILSDRNSDVTKTEWESSMAVEPAQRSSIGDDGTQPLDPAIIPGGVVERAQNPTAAATTRLAERLSPLSTETPPPTDTLSPSIVTTPSRAKPDLAAGGHWYSMLPDHESDALMPSDFLPLTSEAPPAVNNVCRTDTDHSKASPNPSESVANSRWKMSGSCDASLRINRCLQGVDIDGEVRSHPNIQIGDVIDFAIDVLVPSGQTAKTALQGTLEHGLLFLRGSASIKADPGLLSTLPSFLNLEQPPRNSEGQQRLNYDFGTLTNSDPDETRRIRVTFQAVVCHFAPPERAPHEPVHGRGRGDSCQVMPSGGEPCVLSVDQDTQHENTLTMNAYPWETFVADTGFWTNSDFEIESQLQPGSRSPDAAFGPDHSRLTWCTLKSPQFTKQSGRSNCTHEFDSRQWLVHPETWTDEVSPGEASQDGVWPNDAWNETINQKSASSPVPQEHSVESVPEIGVHKCLVHKESDRLRQVDQLTYELVVTNPGKLTLSDLSLIENAIDQHGLQFRRVISDPEIIRSSACENPALAEWDGINHVDMFDGTSGILRPGECLRIRFGIEVDQLARDERDSISITENRRTNIAAPKMKRPPTRSPKRGLPFVPTPAASATIPIRRR